MSRSTRILTALVAILPVWGTGRAGASDAGDTSSIDHVAFTNQVSRDAEAYEREHASNEAFGGIWIALEDGRWTLVVAAVQGADLDTTQLRSVLRDVPVKVVAVTNSSAALERERVRLVAVDRADPGFSISTYTDLIANRVVLLPEEHPLDQRATASLHLDASMATLGETVRAGITSYQGGQALSSGCTAGFMVKVSGGSGVGTLTAGHCGNSGISQSNVNGGASVALGTAVAEKLSGNADRQVHPATAPYTVSTTLFNGGGPIVGTVSAVVGGALCKYGNTTGTLCGTIEATNYAPSWVPSATASFILTTSAVIALGGDSGGPNYNGNYALGITSGCITTAPDCSTYPTGSQWNKAVVTKIANALSGTGYVLY